MLKNITILFIVVLIANTKTVAQNFTNGNFNSQASGWGCNPEANNVERTYGGSSTTNRVAEVDASAGLCQTVSGFTVGYIYTLSLDVSRRTNCGPTYQAMSVTISNGALSTSVSRNGGGFAFTKETFAFTATSTSHTFTFAGTTTGTCGLIVDNISLAFTALPVELVSFSCKEIAHSALIEWETASELDNDYFSIERSRNSIDWETLALVGGAGTSNHQINYSYADENPLSGQSYYRLKQTDYNGEFSYSDIESVNFDPSTQIKIYPNPTVNYITIEWNTIEEPEYNISNLFGENLTDQIASNFLNGKTQLDLSSLRAGIYIITTKVNTYKVYKQ